MTGGPPAMRVRLTLIFLALATGVAIGYLAGRPVADRVDPVAPVNALLESLKTQEQGSKNLGRAIEHLAKAVELLGDGTRETKAEVVRLKRIIEEIQVEQKRGNVQ